MVNLHAQPQAPPPLRDRLGDFQRIKPPTFSHAVELMDVDDSLESIKKKLQVVQCNNREKVLLASHQLSGPTADRCPNPCTRANQPATTTPAPTHGANSVPVATK
jgi:hypothetical protein